ncbi:unnamed protein product [Ceutorhynchus assimilis]|uniref:BPTI/Kunitz inhibitor domain-containing protein n=1 Tax=Ceutorhynchus assimilis TaxID=467358 RepID=A0A9N9MHI2_9CUCU|nr:unnamed protein product [Ceutorhynchus assimilis]
MQSLYIFILVLVAFQVCYGRVVDDAPEINRRIHGSYGAFRDFTDEDCDRPYQNKWMRCSGGETNAFIYHWNNKLKGCERAIYKGCGATRNNFLTEAACNNQAKPICTKQKKT